MSTKAIALLRQPTGRERPWDEEEIIVSKTDLKGKITYANDVFQRVSQMTEAELVGRPHNIIRHPDMPRCVFKLLWDRLAARREIFAFVLNMAKSGDHYWAFAHVTPSVDAAGAVTGYHSNRRKPRAEQVARIAPIYEALLREEARHASPKDGMAAATQLLLAELEKTGMGYDEFVFSV